MSDATPSMQAVTPDRSPRIDVHTHMLEPRASEAGAPHSVVTGFGARSAAPATPDRAASLTRRAGYDPEHHIEMLDRLGLDAEVVLSMTVRQGTSWAPSDLARELERGINDEIARWVRAHPTRLIASFTLPLQSQERSLDELARCTTELGMRVVQLPAAIGGVYLTDPRFHYLWEQIAALGLVAFVHPDGVRDPWFQRYSMWNSVGQPIEEAKFLASLIYEGLLDRLPELRIVMAHGGGYLPHYYGRLDRNVGAHASSAENISRLPSEYLRCLYYDTVVYAPAILEALIASVGPDRIVMGSDFPVGETDPVGFVGSCAVLTPAEFDGVLGKTLADLLGLAAVRQTLGVVVGAG